MKIRTTCTCPLEIVHDIMRGKWKTIIVFQLRNGGMGLAELERGIEGITQKMLLQHLGELRAFGLIGKIEPDGYPLRVTYFLRERGEKLLRAVRIMQDIGVEYMLENGQADILEHKGIIPAAEGIPTKK